MEKILTFEKGSIEIIRSFLNSKRIYLDIESILENVIIKSTNFEELPLDIIDSIIFDAYGGSNKTLRKISEKIEKDHEILLGRVLKNFVKKYIDYKCDYFFENFFSYFSFNYKDFNENELKEYIDNFLNLESYNNARKNSVTDFITNLRNVVNVKNESRIFDYINFLYSRLLNFNELRKISLKYQFKHNEKRIKKELTENEIEILKEYCRDDSLKKRGKIVEKFNKKYLDIIEKRQNYDAKVSVLFLNITKKLFEKFNEKELFYSYILTLIKNSYDLIKNHRILAIKIENIVYNGINLKWEIFSYLTIFAEKFLKQAEHRAYYKPEEIFKDTIEFLYNVKISKNEIELIKKYYNNKVDINAINQIKISKIDNFQKILDDFKNIYTGFTFNDCFILSSNENFKEKSNELHFIKNINEILLIFSKHKFNDDKIPCPVCGSLNISGNSFPKVGIRSWECKNPLCGERSKTNRGKRYSERTIFMQESTFDLSIENLIPRDLISRWRKDIVNLKDNLDIYKMLIKYYSYMNDRIIIIDEMSEKNNHKDGINNFINQEKRKIKFLIPSDLMDPSDEKSYDRALFNDFFNSKNFSYCNHFITKNFILNRFEEFEENLNFIYHNPKNIKLIHGDCLKILKKLKPDSIDCMVTSPPYYNAREYSQWTNLYSYLNNMYKINISANYALKPGGVFIYNIGDIFGNQNITVKSKMGEGRIPLGSYIILLFLKAGFILMEDIIWNKGEPQTHRHKNDGNYAPFYQRPANCYEHVFIFKKKSAPLRVNKNLQKNPWKNNIPKFSPVIKIDTNGENRYGHSAPFPPDIPLFAVLCFTNKGEIVLDPFSGSATSAISAANIGRIGVGIEILENYLKLSLNKAKNAGIKVELYSKEMKLNDYKDKINLNIEKVKTKKNQIAIDKFF